MRKAKGNNVSQSLNLKDGRLGVGHQLFVTQTGKSLLADDPEDLLPDLGLNLRVTHHVKGSPAESGAK